jgi:hypothetical protein
VLACDLEDTPNLFATDCRLVLAVSHFALACFCPSASGRIGRTFVDFNVSTHGSGHSVPQRRQR